MSREDEVIARLERIERQLRLLTVRMLGKPEGVDDAGIQFITELEGSKLVPYRDQAGFLTVGVGHKLHGATDPYNRPITQAESDMLLKGDLAIVEQAINEYAVVPMTQNQYNATASLVFNIGVDAFKDSTLLKRLNESNYKQAADQFLVWNKITVDGKKVVSEGLKNRRARERVLFIQEIQLRANA